MVFSFASGEAQVEEYQNTCFKNPGRSCFLLSLNFNVRGLTDANISRQRKSLYGGGGGGGRIAQWLVYLNPDPAALGSIPSVPNFFQNRLVAGNYYKKEYALIIWKKTFQLIFMNSLDFSVFMVIGTNLSSSQLIKNGPTDTPRKIHRKYFWWFGHL